MNAAILFHLGLAAYTVSASAYLFWLVRPGETAARVGDRALTLGFAFQGVAVALDLFRVARTGTFGFAEGLSFLAFLTVGACLLLRRFYKLPVIGAFVAPLVIAVLVPAHLASTGIQVAFSPQVQWVLLAIHVSVALAGLSLFALGSGVGGMYLLLEHEVKQKRQGAMFRRLPSLDILDRVNYLLVVLGFLALSFTIVTGSLFTRTGATDMGVLFHPRQGFSLIAWGLVAGVLILRHWVGWRGRKVALATMFGLVLMASAYASVFAGSPA